MDVVGASVSLSTPCLGLAFATFRSLCSSIQYVRWNKLQLRAITTSVAQLLETLDGKIQTGGLVESQISPEVDDLQTLIQEIDSFVQYEEGRGFVKLLFNKDDRIATIEIYYRRLCSCVKTFQISALIDTQDWQKRNDNGRDADEQLLNDRLTVLEANQVKLREALGVNHYNVVALIISLQKFLMKRLCSEREHRFFVSTLNHLTEFSGKRVDIEHWMITSFDVEYGPEIGPRGFGQVFKGVWNGKQVALKVLETASCVTPSLGLIRREIGAWSALRHPHILQFIGANVFDDRPFIVMPFLKNGNAQDYVYDHPECNRTTILHHISLGLLHLHDNNVMHGNLKAFNVLVDDAGHAVLCDFGLSHIKSDIATRSMKQGNTSVLESRNWMSPERIMGGALRKPVDIYAFGMTMFEILTGDVPLGHIAYMDFIPLVVNLNVRPERPEDDKPFKISGRLWSLAESCWAKTPQDRPTALAVSETISNILTLFVPQVDLSPSPLSFATTPVYRETPAPSIISKDVPTNVSSVTSSNSPTMGSFYTHLSTSDISSHSELPKYDDIGGDRRPRGIESLRISSASSSGSILSPLETILSNTSPVTTKNYSLATKPRKLRPTTTESITRSRVLSLPPRYSTEFGPILANRTPGTIRNQVSLPTWPHAVVRQEPSESGNQNAGLAPSDATRSSEGTNALPAQPQTGDAYPLVNSGMDEDLDTATNNALGPSKPPPRKGRPATPRLKIPNLWPRRTEPTTGNTSADGESVTGKQNRLGHMASWFGRPSLTAQTRSPEVFAFRLPSEELWSLDDLLERWISRSSNVTEDEEFQDIFLATYTAFTNCLEVFKGLRLRFSAAETADASAQVRAARRHNIISAMKYWVSSPYMPVDGHVLARMKEFANSVTSSSFMGQKAKEITNLLDGQAEDYPLPSFSEPVMGVSALLDNSSEQIAAALTTLEGVLYSRIRPVDYINHLRESQCPNRVADACINTRKITFWVKQKVLRSDVIKRRGKAFRFFLNTAENCYQMRNFSSTAAIIIALKSELIQGLLETLEELDNDDQMLLAKLSSFVKSEEAYRTALDSSGDPCVPRLEFHLRDISPVLRSCVRIRKGSPVAINITGCITLAARIRDVTKFRIPAGRADPEKLPYLLKQLASIDISTTANDQLRQRSQRLRAEEGKLYQSRTRALGISGFAT